MTESKQAIAVEGLSKSYGSELGVENVSFSVEGGEIFGFLGPNGAGKTTCIRLLLNLLRPDSGRITVLGRTLCPGEWRYKARVGFLPGELSWWPLLTGLELLEFFDRFSTQPASLRALVRHSFFEFCRRFRKAGKTVFLSSHNLAETNEICDRVGIIRAGRIVALERMAALRAKSTRRVEALFAERPRAQWFDCAGVDLIEIDGKRALLTCRGDPVPLLKVLAARPVRDLLVSPPALDDLFHSLFSDRGGRG